MNEETKEEILNIPIAFKHAHKSITPLQTAKAASNADFIVDSMKESEKKRFPDFSLNPNIYLLIRNYILARCQNNCDKYLQLSHIEKYIKVEFKNIFPKYIHI